MNKKYQDKTADCYFIGAHEIFYFVSALFSVRDFCYSQNVIAKPSSHHSLVRDAEHVGIANINKSLEIIFTEVSK